MAKKPDFAVVHDLSSLLVPNDEAASRKALRDYLDKVSAFIGLDPALNGLDTIWMQNENGPGRSLVVYARRGTAEILRNNLGIDVKSLIHDTVGGAIVFTATGQNEMERQEVATGSKSIAGLTGKALDDAIMTASTRALRRLTMQFTTLGILDESEVVAVVGQDVNPAGSAQLASNPMPVQFTQPTMPPNNAPGKDVTKVETTGQQQAVTDIKIPEEKRNAFALATGAQLTPSAANVGKVLAEQTIAQVHEPKLAEVQFLGQQDQIDAAVAKIKTVEEEEKPAPKKRTRKAKAVVLDDVEPETVAAPKQANPAVPPQANSVPPPPQEAPSPAPTGGGSAVGTGQVNTPPSPAGMPSKEQLDEYRKRVSIYTQELPASENMNPVQKMRAFITKYNGGTTPQEMSVKQWEEQFAFFTEFVEKNKVKGLVKYINDTLGVK